MEKSISIVSLLIAVVIFFAVGFGAGFYYLNQTSQGNSSLIKALASKVVPSIVAYGKVSKIAGKTISLTSGADSIDIVVQEEAPVNTYSQKDNSYAKIKLTDIKVGDTLNVVMKITEENKLEGISVIKLPAE